MIENYAVEGQMSLPGLDIWCGKTSPEACQVPEKDTPEKTSKRSSQKSSGSSAKTRPMFLFLMAGGPTADASAEWVTLDYPFPFVGTSTMLNGGVSRKDAAGLHWWQISTDLLPGELSLTLNCGEKPTEPNPTRLSQVLEENADERYNLSAQACAGILRRAEKRGKQLPDQLRTALLHTLSKSGGGAERDSSGRLAGKGPLVQTELSATLGVSQDQTLIKPDDVVKSSSIHQNGSGEVRLSDNAYTLSTNSNASGRNTPLAVINVNEIAGITIPIHDQATRFAGKRGEKHDGKGNGLGIGSPEDPSPTISSGDHHAVFRSDLDRQNNSCQLNLYEQHSQDSRYNPLGEVGETVSAKYGTGGNNTPIVIGRKS